MDPMMMRQRQEQRRTRMEQFQQSRRSMMRWRWVMIGLGGLLAVALLANGSYLIGGILAVLLVMRLVMFTRMQRMWKEREAMFAGRRDGAVDVPERDLP